MASSISLPAFSNLASNTLNADGTPISQSFAPTNGGMFRNRIINGDMRIDQRNAGVAVTAEGYLVDRWRVWRDQTYSIVQSTDAPIGFANSLAVTKTNTVQSTYGYLVQYVEGFNFSDMLFGTANARSLTISFWVKSSVTGSFSVGITNSAENRNYPATYTINSANTWEYKTVFIPGDTSGTWIGSTSGKGDGVWFNFGTTGALSANTWSAVGVGPASTGSANLGTTNGATFLVTGVQLEKGSSATPFEFRPIGTELALCQRYFYSAYNSSAFTGGGAASATQFYSMYVLSVAPRIAPTISFVGVDGGNLFSISDQYLADFTSTTPTVITQPVSAFTGITGRVFIGGFTGLTSSRWYGGCPNGSTAARTWFSMEL